MLCGTRRVVLGFELKSGFVVVFGTRGRLSQIGSERYVWFKTSTDIRTLIFHKYL